MTASLFPPFPIIPDDAGQPLNGGFVYIGTANLDPVANPIAIFFDTALTVAAAQPLRTSGGFIVDGNGSPANVYWSASDASVQVNDANNEVLYSIPSYQVRFNAENITFGAVVVSTSINPDAAGGASNGALATAWSNTVTQGLQAKTGTVYNQAQPAVAADLAALNQRKNLLMSGRQTSAAGAAVLVNIYNCASITRTAAGVYEIVPTIALPSNFSVQLTMTTDPGFDVRLYPFSRSTTLIVVRSFYNAALNDLPFDFVVFGNPAVADPIT